MHLARKLLLCTYCTIAAHGQALSCSASNSSCQVADGAADVSLCCNDISQKSPEHLKQCANTTAPLFDRKGVAFALVLSHGTLDMDYYAPYSALSVALWCRLHGHAFVLDDRDGGRGWENSKVPIMLHWMKAARIQKVKWLVWVDGDVAFLHQDNDRDYIRGIIDQYARDGINMLISEDLMMGKVSLRFNTGTLLLRCSAWTERFLQVWFDHLQKANVVDQISLEQLHQEDTLGVRKHLRSLQPHVFNSLSMNLLQGPTADSQPLIHLMGLDSEMRRVMFETVLISACARNDTKGTNFSFLQDVYEKQLRSQGADFKARKVLAQHLHLNGHRAKAVELYHKIVEDQLASYHKFNSSTLDLTNSFACLMQDMGKLEESEHLFRWTLEGRLAIEGMMHPNTLSSANSAGLLLQSLRRNSEAEYCFDIAFKGRKRVLGREHPLTVQSEGNLIEVLLDQGRHDDAIAIEPFGISAGNAIAMYHSDRGNMQEATKTLQRVIDLHAHNVDSEKDLPNLTYNMGVLLSRSERSKEADFFFKKAEDEQLRLSQGDHLKKNSKNKRKKDPPPKRQPPTTTTTMLYVTTTRTTTTTTATIRTTTTKAASKKANKTVLLDFDLANRFAGDQANEGDLDGAIYTLRRSLELQRRTFNNEYNFVNTRYNMAVLMSQAGKLKEAENLFEVTIKEIPADHEDVESTKQALRDVRQRLRKGKSR